MVGEGGEEGEGGGWWSVRGCTQAGIAVDQCNVPSCVISGKLSANISDSDKVDKVAVSLSASPC